MNNSNKKISIMDRIKTNIANVFAGLLILQAEQGVKTSFFLIVSEAEFPIEMMRDDAAE